MLNMESAFGFDRKVVPSQKEKRNPKKKPSLKIVKRGRRHTLGTQLSLGAKWGLGEEGKPWNALGKQLRLDGEGRLGKADDTTPDLSALHLVSPDQANDKQ